jgi:hypothetical protein
MNNPQILVVLRDKTKDPDGLNLIQIAVAKKNLPDSHITIVCAVGYEGGGCYSDFCGVYRMDEYSELVTEVIEEIDYPDDSEIFSLELDQLTSWVYKNFVSYDEDLDAYRLNNDIDTLEIEDEKFFDLNFDWDNEAHIQASQNWAISYKWQ